MGLLTFSLNLTLDGCVDHREGIADEETHAFFTRLMDDAGAMLWGRVTYEMMEAYWPAVARGEVAAPPAVRAWADKLQAKPKHVVSRTRTQYPWAHSHAVSGDLRSAIERLKQATPAGVLLGSGQLALALERLDLIDAYRFLVHPRLAGHGPKLFQGGLPATRRLELVSAEPLRNGAVAVHYRRAP
jgi:dihydrofolate reductase